jgi:hypothetical protein
MARRPNQLLADELATLRTLWHLYPDGALMNHDRNHARLADLIDDGYIEATESDLGVIYRLAPEKAEGLAQVTRRNAVQADQN